MTPEGVIATFIGLISGFVCYMLWDIADSLRTIANRARKGGDEE